MSQNPNIFLWSYFSMFHDTSFFVLRINLKNSVLACIGFVKYWLAAARFWLAFWMIIPHLMVIIFCQFYHFFWYIFWETSCEKIQQNLKSRSVYRKRQDWVVTLQPPDEFQVDLFLGKFWSNYNAFLIFMPPIIKTTAFLKNTSDLLIPMKWINITGYDSSPFFTRSMQLKSTNYPVKIH